MKGERMKVRGTIYGVLLNYRGQLEGIREQLDKPPYKEAPTAPVLYIKPANTVSENGAPIPLPPGNAELEMGAALGVVIGKKAVRVKAEEAMDFIEGYTIANDVSIPHESFFRPAIKEKARDGFCPVGPALIGKDEIKHAGDLDIRVWINGELKQENNTRNLIRPIPQLIQDITEFMTLDKGDILLAGIPEGAPLARAGDFVRIEVSGIGFLENTVLSEEGGEEG
ncbi:MAG TPA: fumarylacetoacetate hydrolase family protein [Bacillaceae bacterium]